MESLIRGTSTNPRLCNGIFPFVGMVVAEKEVATAQQRSLDKSLYRWKYFFIARTNYALPTDLSGWIFFLDLFTRTLYYPTVSICLSCPRLLQILVAFCSSPCTFSMVLSSGSPFLGTFGCNKWVAYACGGLYTTRASTHSSLCNPL